MCLLYEDQLGLQREGVTETEREHAADQTDLMLDIARRPALLRERLLAAAPRRLRSPVILDEVQKVPALLDEVHWLIENRGLRFILCGSSARKLRRGRINLLGGRAWRYEMHPFVSAEIGDLDLLRALNRGLVPVHYLDAEYRRSLQAYVVDYLKEEVFDEGLTRNVPAFSRFFEAVGYSHGELVNYANIARDCEVSRGVRSPHLSIIVGLMVVLTLVYYGGRTPLADLGPFFTDAYLHDLHRILYLLPVIYAALTFRIWGAMATSLAFLCVVLPRTFYSPYADALLRPLLFVLFTAVVAVLTALLMDRIDEEREINRRLKETREQLVHAEKLASLGQLSASIAHEINNPLAGVLTYTKLLAKKISGDTLENFLLIISIQIQQNQ